MVVLHIFLSISLIPNYISVFVRRAHSALQTRASYAGEAEAGRGGREGGEGSIVLQGISSRAKRFPSRGFCPLDLLLPRQWEGRHPYFITLNQQISKRAFFVCLCLTRATYLLALSLFVSLKR